MIHFIIATYAEAVPLISFFKLKKKSGRLQFDIFFSSNKKISLTISGIGKIQAVASVIYTNMFFGGVRNNAWINIGIAGHKCEEIGNIFLINNNLDFATKKNYFPIINFEGNFKYQSSITYDYADEKYNDSISDMELSGFFYAAAKSSSIELIQSLKIISDNRSETIDFKDTIKINEIIMKRINIIEELCLKLVSNYIDINELDFENSDIIEKFKPSNVQKKEFLYLKNKHFLYKDYAIIKSLNQFDSIDSFLGFLKRKIR